MENHLDLAYDGIITSGKLQIYCQLFMSNSVCIDVLVLMGQDIIFWPLNIHVHENVLKEVTKYKRLKLNINATCLVM